MTPPPTDVPPIEETYEEYAVGPVTLALIGHPTKGHAWILSDYTLRVER
ncbi:hypothetical protein [Halosolutus gelatinilyticus]|nr:hypothetical protein [Halosolutus gelatinilyticus]